jgi:hypothetical protein
MLGGSSLVWDVQAAPAGRQSSASSSTLKSAEPSHNEAGTAWWQKNAAAVIVSVRLLRLHLYLPQL